MVLGISTVRIARISGRFFMRRDLVKALSLGALLAPAHAFAQAADVPAPSADAAAADQEPGLPRLGLDPAEPDARSAPPATPFGIAPATSSEYVLDFHGYVLLPMRVGIQRRKDPAPGQDGTVLHTPPLIPQDFRRFQYTGVSPEPYIQLDLTYGNSTVAGTVILASTVATEAEAFYDPVRQLGVNSAYLTLNLSKQVGTSFQLRGGALANRYGSMGAFDTGRYATPLIARINSVGETITAGFKKGKLAVVLEEGIGSQVGRMPSGIPPAGWNDFGNPNAGASYVGHFHGGLSLANTFQLGLHYANAFTRDDQNVGGTLQKGGISVVGGDARVTHRFGHFYVGAARTKATNANVVGGVIQILNARDGEGLTREYLGPQSGGNGALTVFGAQYDLSIAKAMFGDRYHGKNPDVLVSLFGIGAKVKSNDPTYDGVLKLKAGGEVTYSMLSWFGASGRFDHVRQDNAKNRRAFTVYTGRLLFHSNWRSRDEFALSYSHFVYGKQVYAETGYPPADDPSQNPDKDIFSLSATFWW